jgi:hypothetical protein
MSTYPNPIQKPDLFEFYSRKLRVVCELHGVKTGLGQTLDVFLGKLESDRHFAMDFWGLAGKLTAREGGDLSDDQMLALIVQVVTGRPMIALLDSDTDPAIALLRAMLAGVDIHRAEPGAPPNSAQTTGTAARAMPVSSIDEARQKLAQIDDSRSRRYTTGLASIPRPPESEPIPPAPIPAAPTQAAPISAPSGPPTTLPSQLHLALQSLEIVSRDMNDHVQKIDQRLVRMEAQTKKIAARADAIGPVMRSPAQIPLNKRGLAQAPADLIAGERQIFETFPSLRDVHWRQNVSIGVVLLSLIAGVITWRYYSPWILQKVHEFVREDIATPPGSMWTQDHRPPVLLPSPTPAAQTPTQAQTQREAPAPPVEQAQTPAAPAAAPLTESEHDAIRAEQDIARMASVVVGQFEMDRYLIFSRAPAYPEEARIAGAHGSVVAQALISKDGTVSRVHIIDGDPRLRGAATDAIYKRRYRPYFFNGAPVEVATTITINFRTSGSRRSRAEPEG